MRFYFILTIFVFVMNLFLLCYDFLSAYIFWEFLGLFSFFLISFFWYRFYALKSGFKAFLIGKIGDLFFFFAIVNNFYIFFVFFFFFFFNFFFVLILIYFFLIHYLFFIFYPFYFFVQCQNLLSLVFTYGYQMLWRGLYLFLLLFMPLH